MFEGLLYAVIYGFLLAFAIGPVFFSLIETSITKGFKCALFLDLGALTSDVIFILIAFFSTNKLLEKLRDDPNLLILGGVILMVYGIISFIQTSKSFRKIVREHYNLNAKKNLTGLFIKGFLLNLVNFGVLGGWIATIVMANALTTSNKSVLVFLTTILVTFFLTDILKISLAKKLKKKLTPKVVFKTKKMVSMLIMGFGILLLIQGVFPNKKIKEKIEETLPISILVQSKKNLQEY